MKSARPTATEGYADYAVSRSGSENPRPVSKQKRSRRKKLGQKDILLPHIVPLSSHVRGPNRAEFVAVLAG